MQDLNCLAALLREAREERHLSDEEVAEATGVNVYLLQALEAGNISQPPLPALTALSKFYELKLLHLLELAGHVSRCGKYLGNFGH